MYVRTTCELRTITCKPIYKRTYCMYVLLSPSLLCRALQPGWSSLTWSSLNIDAFLHNAYSSLDNLRGVAASMDHIHREKICPMLHEIASLPLLDTSTLVGKAWVRNEEWKGTEGIVHVSVRTYIHTYICASYVRTYVRM